MLAQFEENKKNWLFWTVITITALLIVWFAPDEQTLGQGIKSVYVHVALIWVGLAGLVIAGLMGAGVIIWANKKLSAWMQTIGWVAMIFYAAGVGMSIMASKVNWGNVFWQEPRMRVALNMLAVVLILEIVISWVSWIRLQGLLSFGLVVTVAWSTFDAPLVLHPRNPITTSSSSGIQFTFLGLSVVVGLAATRLVWHLRSIKRE